MFNTSPKAGKDCNVQSIHLMNETVMFVFIWGINYISIQIFKEKEKWKIRLHLGRTLNGETRLNRELSANIQFSQFILLAKTVRRW